MSKRVSMVFAVIICSLFVVSFAIALTNNIFCESPHKRLELEVISFFDEDVNYVIDVAAIESHRAYWDDDFDLNDTMVERYAKEGKAYLMYTFNILYYDIHRDSFATKSYLGIVYYEPAPLTNKARQILYIYVNDLRSSL
jgi:hypothetical protein